jgi:hypothetical protein
LNEKGGSNRNKQSINITVPLSKINELYSNTFVQETDPIYVKELHGKALMAGKSITLLKFRPKLKLKLEGEIIKKGSNGRPMLSAQAWFHFSPTDNENNQQDYDFEIAKAKERMEVEADLDISIDQNKGRIQINPKYAVLEAKVSSGGEDSEPFCQLTIPLQLEKLKVELPLGVSKFNVTFPSPINKTFINSGTEFPIQGKIDEQNNKSFIHFEYPIDLEEQRK